MGRPDEEEDATLDKTSVVQSETFKVRLAQAGQAPPCFVLLVGPASAVGRQWPIEDTDRILGRAATAHISVDDRSVSKSHCKIILSGGDVSIMDLESTNKTVVNGRVLTPLVPVKLANNDQVKAGNVIFKFLERGNIETVSAGMTYEKAHTDALTGIANRGGLNSRGVEAFRRAELLGVPFSIITFDIDHFKQVNDTFGHPAGDFVLKEICKVIRERLIRENDFFARSGGEEFCLVLLGSGLNQAHEIGERIRHTIEVHRFEFEGKVIPITISVGVATKQTGDGSWDQVFERADKALYVSKRAGRNRVNVGT
ncbi:MAG: GGDEF domain-containing protein [Bdellovibrionales bacterium]|nr:GGDEF domain-containing protein [Bdellovibrionales bacterium]